MQYADVLQTEVRLKLTARIPELLFTTFSTFLPAAFFDFTRRHYNNRVLEGEQGKPVQKKTVKSRCCAPVLVAACRRKSNQSILRKRGIECVNTAVPTRARYALNKRGKAARGRQNNIKKYSMRFSLNGLTTNNEKPIMIFNRFFQSVCAQNKKTNGEGHPK